MPELPEVETIKRGLNQFLPGKRITRIVVRDSRLRWPVAESKLKKWLVGGEIRQVERRAKYLLVRMQNAATLILHLGMSGRLLLLANATPLDKHDHVVFYFADGFELRFRDPRRFGMVDAVAADEIERHPRLVGLGLEPLARGTLAGLLHAKAKASQRAIKNLLMDSTFIVGIGNIYANEGLFWAGIHPAVPANELSLADWQKLLRELRGVLNEAIRKGGTTLNDFVNSAGEAGYFQLALAVYGKEGQACPRCESKVERLVQTGRSSFVCPQCQPLRGSR